MPLLGESLRAIIAREKSPLAVLRISNTDFCSSPNYRDLTLITNDGSGQNKSKHTMRFLMNLVETKVFLKTTLSFLVKGYFKRLCDIILNLVKKGHHSRSACACDGIHSSMNERNHIDADPMSKEDFYDTRVVRHAS